jgi:hypothetical protein
MKDRKFLDEINDVQNRIFPLHYKHLKVQKLRYSKLLINKDVAVRDYQTVNYPVFLFYKPLSKML